MHPIKTKLLHTYEIYTPNGSKDVYTNSFCAEVQTDATWKEEDGFLLVCYNDNGKSTIITSKLDDLTKLSITEGSIKGDLDTQRPLWLNAWTKSTLLNQQAGMETLRFPIYTTQLEFNHARTGLFIEATYQVWNQAHAEPKDLLHIVHTEIFIAKQ